MMQLLAETQRLVKKLATIHDHSHLRRGQNAWAVCDLVGASVAAAVAAAVTVTVTVTVTLTSSASATMPETTLS